MARPKRSSIASPRAPAPRLPVEVTELCLQLYVRRERKRHYKAPLRKIALLRLISRRFRDVFTKELFESVTLALVPIQRRPRGFLDLVRTNDDILKHIRHVTIQVSTPENHLASTDVHQACTVVRVFSQAPLRTLTIEGLDKEFEHSAIFNALHTLRCVRSLQTLNISGSAVPPFLVCGHFASTPLKSIQFPSPSSPYEPRSGNLLMSHGISIGPDSVLASEFQPFANIEELDVPNAADVPKYFPLQDFGSAYYPSNGGIPFTLPVLRKLQVGTPDQLDDDAMALGAQDYEVLGTLLSHAPRLETLCIVDDFQSHNGLNILSPFVDELPSLKNLRRLEFVALCEGYHSITSTADILAAFSLFPTLKTLCMDFRWCTGTVDEMRARLHFTGAWRKLQRALASPALASVEVLILGIEIVIYEVSCDRQETFGPEEVDAFKGSLVNLYSRDGKLDVTVNIGVRVW